MIKSTEVRKKLVNLFSDNNWEPISYDKKIIAEALGLESMKIYNIYFGKLGYIRTCVIAGKNYYKATEKLEKIGKK